MDGIVTGNMVNAVILAFGHVRNTTTDPVTGRRMSQHVRQRAMALAACNVISDVVADRFRAELDRANREAERLHKRITILTAERDAALARQRAPMFPGLSDDPLALWEGAGSDAQADTR